MGTGSALGEVAFEKVLAVKGRFHQKQQDSTFHARIWVYFSSCYSDAVGPASQFACCIVECEIINLLFLKVTEMVTTKVKHRTSVGKWEVIFIFFFFLRERGCCLIWFCFLHVVITHTGIHLAVSFQSESWFVVLTPWANNHSDSGICVSLHCGALCTCSLHVSCQ